MPISSIERLLAAADQALQRVLVRVRRVHQREQREQHHLHLLRRRQARRVIQRDGAAVGDQAVDELELVRLRRDRLVALVQFLLRVLRQCRRSAGRARCRDASRSCRDASRSRRSTSSTSTRGSCSSGASANSETKSSANVPYTSSVSRIRSGRSFDDVGDVLEALVVDLHRRRIARIHEEERLHLRIAQLVEFLLRILPAVRRRRLRD